MKEIYADGAKAARSRREEQPRSSATAAVPRETNVIAASRILII
jgi:hypothetical protein